MGSIFSRNNNNNNIKKYKEFIQSNPPTYHVEKKRSIFSDRSDKSSHPSNKFPVTDGFTYNNKYPFEIFKYDTIMNDPRNMYLFPRDTTTTEIIDDKIHK